MLAVEDLTTDYGPVRAVDHVSLEVPPGSVTAVLGANGAGKTSLLRTITGLVRPSAGRVTFDGEDITRLPVEEIVRRGIAHVPEGRGVITELTVEENLRLGGLWRGRDAAPRRRSTSSSRGSRNARTSRRRGSRAASARCSRSAARSSRVPARCCSTSRRWGSRRCSSPRSCRSCAGSPTRSIWRYCWSSRTPAARCRSPSAAIVLNLGRVVADVNAAELVADERLRHAYLGF